MKTPPKHSTHIKTQAQLLAAFRAVYVGKGDGKREMANWIGVSHAAVCNWFMQPADGRPPLGIPSGYHAQLFFWGVHHGYRVHPEAFGLAPDGKPLMIRSAAEAA